MRLTASLLVLATAAPAMAAIDVYLVAGQSNAHGVGTFSELSTELKQPYTPVDYFYRSTATADAADTGGEGTLGPLIANSAFNSRFGPELMMGRQLDAVSDNDVAIIKHARSGTTLGNNWYAGGDDTATGDGPILQAFYKTVNDGLAALQAAHPAETLNLKGLAWMQGESDAYTPSFANAYEARLRTFTQDVRATLGDDLLIAIGQLSENMTNYEGVAGYTTVRNAQATIAGESDLNILINTDDLTTRPGDEIHFNTAGQIQLGQRFASALVPEPASLALPLVAGAAMLRRRRKA